PSLSLSEGITRNVEFADFAHTIGAHCVHENFFSWCLETLKFMKPFPSLIHLDPPYLLTNNHWDEKIDFGMSLNCLGLPIHGQESTTSVKEMVMAILYVLNVRYR